MKRILLSLVIYFFSYSLFADNFITLSDLHFNPFLACDKTNVKPCPLINQLIQSPIKKWADLFIQYPANFSTFKQDSDNQLLMSALNEAQQKAKTNHAEFVLVLGDYLSHHYRDNYKKYSLDKSRRGYEAFAKKTLQFVTLQIAEHFPNVDVYMTVGNNDAYHGDYYVEPNSLFYSDMSGLWSRLIKNENNRLEMEKQFVDGGYYTLTLPKYPKIRLIVLNSVAFSAKAKGDEVGEVAETQLKWLHQTLKTAHEKHQKVIIAMHIPTGIDVYASLKIKLFTLVELWKSNYTAQYQNEINQFSNDIMGIFAGHLHMDWFQIANPDQNEIPILGTPSISPIFGNNPGFKLFSFDAHHLNLNNFITYYYPLDANKTWGKEYVFSQLYSSRCSQCPILDGIKKIQEKGALAESYKNFYAVDTKSQPISSNWFPYYWCAIKETSKDNYRKCIK